MAKVWFEAKNIKEALKIAFKIYDLKEFSDDCVMIETPKRAIAVVGGEKPVGKKLIQKINKEKLSEMR